jgi:hypothetical protein
LNIILKYYTGAVELINDAITLRNRHILALEKPVMEESYKG